MGVRLGQSGGYPTQTRGEHHRPGDVPAAAENDVGLPPRQDPQAGERRARREEECPEEPDPDPPRESRDGERVELEARFRNQLRLDAVGRPGEGHRHPALA